MSKDKKGNDEYVLMKQIYDNLQFLDYEIEFDPVKRHLPYLTPIYFAIPGQSAKEQFDYFASLCIWMMQSYLGSDIETPSDYDEPAQVADNLILALPSIGFKLNFSSSKLVSGHGLAVCTILDAIIRLTLKKRHFTPNPLRVISGIGGTEDVQVVGEEEDEDGVIDDAIDIQSDDENEDNESVDFNQISTGKVIDSLELKTEAEKVASRLQIHIPSAKSDWRTHFAQMNQHQHRITEIITQLTPILSKVGANVTKAVQAIETREKTLNQRFETSVSDYAAKASELAVVEKVYRERVEHVNALQEELNSVAAKLDSTKQNLSEKQKEVSDNSPLIKIKQAITKMREEIKELELRSSILQRSLTQTWIDDREN
ncbi:intraflagellar transport protein [Histomonas meleagridis]|uniref:intraflagellar transport protein 57-like n=1 Tax=Histomonas meleagridis TaxID=135588 RepID=UPI00355AB782|nr:intraflagellar transport protein [Histomonas meleagridis]KAH0798796.1 intraflagellar transport protein 57-like [Histomonas meleagridis]